MPNMLYSTCNLHCVCEGQFRRQSTRLVTRAALFNTPPICRRETTTSRSKSHLSIITYAILTVRVNHKTSLVILKPLFCAVTSCNTCVVACSNKNQNIVTMVDRTAGQFRACVLTSASNINIIRTDRACRDYISIP